MNYTLKPQILTNPQLVFCIYTQVKSSQQSFVVQFFGKGLKIIIKSEIFSLF